MNGNLALSRAIGDFEFKKSAELPPENQIVTAFPDVEVHDITEDDEFLVIACDGTSSRFPSRAIADSAQVSGTASPRKLSSNLCAGALLPSRSCPPFAKT